MLVIVGPSGCGKSTFLRCLNALEDIQEGEIILDGSPVKKTPSDLARLRQRVGMVFQSYDLFPHMTVLQNVMLAPVKVRKRDKKEVEKEALELLKRVGLLSLRGQSSRSPRHTNPELAFLHGPPS